MKLIRKSTVAKGQEIPDGQDGFITEQVAESKWDEIVIFEDEARKTIASIIKKVEGVTGRELNVHGRNAGD